MAKKYMKGDWISPAEFCLRHKDIKQRWKEQDLGYLLYLKLVSGVKLTRSCKISESEVVALYEERITRNSLNPTEKAFIESKQDWLTPEAFFVKHPGIKKIWNERHLGYLLRLGICQGRKLSKSCLMSETEILNVYKKWVCRIVE